MPKQKLSPTERQPREYHTEWALYADSEPEKQKPEAARNDGGKPASRAAVEPKCKRMAAGAA